MTKTNNIASLKAMMNEAIDNTVKTYLSGVQAYNIAEDREYNVIVKAEKIGNRYYFIDREGARFLISRYDRAEFVAGEILENVAIAQKTAESLADTLNTYGHVGVHFDLVSMFSDACEARGLRFHLVGCHIHNTGDIYEQYEQDAPTSDPTENEPIAETETVETEATEAAAPVAEVDEDVKVFATYNENGAIAALAVRFALVAGRIARKVWAGVKSIAPTVRAWSGLAFLLVLGVFCMVGITCGAGAVTKACGLSCGSWSCIVSMFVLMFTVGLDLGIWVLYNAGYILSSCGTFDAFGGGSYDKGIMWHPVSVIGHLYNEMNK